MVVGILTMDPPSERQPTPSSQLKFGMDRILSREPTENTYQPRELSPPLSTFYFPTALRYCSQTGPTLASTFYRQTVHVPQPLRPFTNVLVQSDLGESSHLPNPQHKRKRSWSRAVFSNLQRKGLEKRFQLQKYITKPDRRQLAATLGLTDAQVKVWFQNRRMKWRHTKEGVREELVDGNTGESSLMTAADSTQERNLISESDSDIDVQTIDSEK